MEIYICGTDKRSQSCRDYLLSHQPGVPVPRIVLFPFPHPISDEAAEEIRSGDLAVGYAFPPALAAKIKDKHADVLEVGKDEGYVAENSALTALAFVSEYAERTGCAPGDRSFGVIGFGSLGQALVRLLTFLGAKVTVYTGRAEVRRSLGALGMRVEEMVYGEEPTGILPEDVLINTAPAPLRLAGHVRPGVTVYELASGENLSDGVLCVRLPSLPARRLPIGAGSALARAILRRLRSSAYRGGDGDDGVLGEGGA